MALAKLSKNEFTELRDSSSLKYKTPHFLFVYKNKEKKALNSDSTFKFGITITKKKVKNAVDRNRLKRLLRESIRMLDPADSAHEVLVNVIFTSSKKQPAQTIKFNDVYEEVRAFINKKNK